MNKDYLIERTKEVERALSNKLREKGVRWGECFLDLHPEFPCDEFFAVCNITFMENDEPFFTYLGAFQEDVISLPNEKAVDKILEELINGPKKKLENAKENGEHKSFAIKTENILKRLESNRR